MQQNGHKAKTTKTQQRYMASVANKENENAIRMTDF